MSYSSISKVDNLAIVGGTHGNELTGVFAIKKYEQFPHLIQRSTFKTHTLLANPKAIELGRRYVDIDLNRCFKLQDLKNSTLVNNYEQIRAKQIAQNFQEQKIDFIIDLHSTTSNMGVTIILNNSHPFLLRLSAHLCSINPLVKVLQYQSSQDSPYLRNLSELSLAIEVGAVSQGILNPELFLQTETVIQQILDYIDNFNQGKLLESAKTLTLYRQVANLDYPRDKQGQLQAMIHPQLLFKDYDPLYFHTPLFISFDGKEIGFDGQEMGFPGETKSTVYHPVFIAEAAYLEKNIALTLTVKKQLPL